MSIASWKVRAGLPVALVLVWICAPAQAQEIGSGSVSANLPNAKPVITSIAAVQVPGQKFRIYGTVTDDTPASCTVTLTGAASGTVACNASGQFDATFDVAALGTATAVASDGAQSSDPAAVTLANTAPTTTCKCVAGPNGSLTISGTVTDEAPAGLVVTLSGARAVNGLSAIVLANGTWSTVANIPAGTHGTITAKVTDWYGLTGTGSGAY